MLNRRDTMRLCLGALAGVAGKAGVAVAGVAGITEGTRVGSDVNAPSKHLQVTYRTPGKTVVIGYVDGTKTRSVSTGPSAGKFIREPDPRSPVEVAREILDKHLPLSSSERRHDDRAYINGVDSTLYGKHRVVASVLAIQSNKRGSFHETEGFSVSARDTEGGDIAAIERLLVERRNRSMMWCIAANPGKQVVYWCNWWPSVTRSARDGFIDMFVDDCGCAAVWDERDLRCIDGTVTSLDVTDDTHYQDNGIDLDKVMVRRKFGDRGAQYTWKELLAKASVV